MNAGSSTHASTTLIAAGESGEDPPPLLPLCHTLLLAIIEIDYRYLNAH